MARNDTKEVASTEYAVEIYRDVNGVKKLVSQIDCFPTYEKAEECLKSYEKDKLGPEEYLGIIFIDYDENEEEVDFGTVC